MDEEDEISMSPPKAFAPKRVSKRRSTSKESSPEAIYGKRSRLGASGGESSSEGVPSPPEAPVAEIVIQEAPVAEIVIQEAPVAEIVIPEPPTPGPSHRKTRSFDNHTLHSLQDVEHRFAISRSYSHLPTATGTGIGSALMTNRGVPIPGNEQVVVEEMDTSGSDDDLPQAPQLVEQIGGPRQPFRNAQVDLYPWNTRMVCAVERCRKPLNGRLAVTCESNPQHVYCMACMMNFIHTNHSPYYCPSGERCRARGFNAPWQCTARHLRQVKEAYMLNK